MNKSVPYFVAIVFVTLLFVNKFYRLQIADKKYRLMGDQNALYADYKLPARGHIFDRNGKQLVSNQPSYQVSFILSEVSTFDTLKLANLLNIDTLEIREKLLHAKSYRRKYTKEILVKQIGKENLSSFFETQYQFKGFYAEKKPLRKYNYKNAANVLGYIGETTPTFLKKNKNYNLGDLAGITGVEKVYEYDLRGRRGVEYLMKDASNKRLGSYENGAYDTLAISGKDIELTIDIELQDFVESLLHEKRGGVVAIQPQTGEILAMAASPNFSPDLFVGEDRNANYVKLLRDTISQPLFDRAIQGTYSPGSPFKIITGLVALQEGAVNDTMVYTCRGGFRVGGRIRMGCHAYGTHNMRSAITHSCNNYFAQVYKSSIDKYQNVEQGLDVWADHVRSFSLGSYMGNDLSAGAPGLIPDSKYYNGRYGKDKWGALMTISNSIGQGEVSTTPLQLANVAAIVANKGYYYTPHIVRKIDNQPVTDPQFTKRKLTSIDPKHFDVIIEGMYGVFTRGTARRSRVRGIEMCGKTGTTENYAKIDGKVKKLRDHSIFMAFAPKDNPKIAVAVFIENGGYGATWAGPIASLTMEKYINKKIKSRRRLYRMQHYGLRGVYNNIDYLKYGKQLPEVDSIGAKRDSL